MARVYQQFQTKMHPEHSDYYLISLRVNGCYFWFSIFQILTTIVLIILLVLQRYEEAAILEIFIAFLVALDLLIRYFTQGTQHFRNNWDNRINLVILLLLAASITSDLVAPQVTHHDGGIIASIFLFVRYIVQSVRLCRLLFESKKALELTKHQNISLSEIIQEESGDNSH